jgi:DNA invertase Pin-like site-specific DNA recombinase
MNVIGYARLSKSSEEGHSIPAQERAIAAYCERTGLELLRVEVDDGVSGRSMKKRPALARALDACRAGEASGLVAARLDRVTRSLLDFARLVEDAEKHRYSLVVIDQAFDLSTPHGRAMAGMLAVFSQYERDLISARTRSALAHVKKNGSKSGRKIGNPAFKPVPAAVAALIRELRAGGATYREIAETLQARGFPTARGGARWRPETIRNIAVREIAA